MSATLSPRQTESVERWLDTSVLGKEDRDDIFTRRPTSSRTNIINNNPASNPINSSRGVRGGIRDFHLPLNQQRRQAQRQSQQQLGQAHDRDLHVRSRQLQRSRQHGSFHHDHGHDHDAYIDPVECFLRVCSACLASGALGVAAITLLLVRATSPTGGNPLDIRLNWVIGIPVAGLALLWQLVRLGLLAWHKQDRSNALLAADVLLEAVLGVGSVICAVLAGFQAARHLAYNRRHDGDGTPTYHDIGPAIALVALLALLALSSFGVLALSFVEANWRRRASSSNRSTSSSVIEIIS